MHALLHRHQSLNTRAELPLIGVADDSTIVGIELDGFTSGGQFLLHLYQVLTRSLGAHTDLLVNASVVPAA